MIGVCKTGGYRLTVRRGRLKGDPKGTFFTWGVGGVQNGMPVRVLMAGTVTIYILSGTWMSKTLSD